MNSINSLVPVVSTLRLLSHSKSLGLASLRLRGFGCNTHQRLILCFTRGTSSRLHAFAKMEKDVSTWTGSGTQDDFMLYDTCIVVDKNDNIVGNGTKKDCHIFREGQSGMLHRAFSVFLFDEENRLLLQKRAAEKITFPEVWTNTCCSHPLHGFTPSEVDPPEAILDGSVHGVKMAAIRKLGHELGIPSSQLQISDFKFLTRLHYCASDVPKIGSSWSWGEHEMDYILFIKKPLDVHPNPEEVSDVRYVHLSELQEMMLPNNGLKWSPWFRIIEKNFLEKWWNDLEATLTTEKHVDVHTIHPLNV